MASSACGCGVPDAARRRWPSQSRRELQTRRRSPCSTACVAPFTGVFYRSPTPSARAYVSEGDWVDADAVIGLVETMKIFNEVTADVFGPHRQLRGRQRASWCTPAIALVLVEPGERATAESEPHDREHG